MNHEDLKTLIKRTLATEKVHFLKVTGIESEFYVPIGVASVLAHMAYHWGEQSTLKLLLKIMEDGNNPEEVSEYIKSKLNQY